MGATAIKQERLTVQILRDLVTKGLQGDELISAFESEEERIERAIDLMTQEADAVAKGEKKAYNYEDIFGEG